MSNLKERTIQTIQDEYTQACARAGHLGYQIETLKKDLEKVHDLLLNLNIEGASITAKAKESAGSSNA